MLIVVRRVDEGVGPFFVAFINISDRIARELLFLISLVLVLQVAFKVGTILGSELLVDPDLYLRIIHLVHDKNHEQSH